MAAIVEALYSSDKAEPQADDKRDHREYENQLIRLTQGEKYYPRDPFALPTK